MSLEEFAKSYLAMQGVQVLTPCKKVEARAIKAMREPEFVPVTRQYER